MEDTDVNDDVIKENHKHEVDKLDESSPFDCDQMISDNDAIDDVTMVITLGLHRLDTTNANDINEEQAPILSERTFSLDPRSIQTSRSSSAVGVDEPNGEPQDAFAHCNENSYPDISSECPFHGGNPGHGVDVRAQNKTDRRQKTRRDKSKQGARGSRKSRGNKNQNETFDADIETVNIIDRVQRETTYFNKTLLSFNRKHKPLPSISPTSRYAAPHK